MMSILQLENVSVIYGDNVQTKGLNNLSLETKAGEFVAIMGPSGSGKSTLLNTVAGILPATSGRIQVAGRAIDGLSDEEAAQFRREELGFVFQEFNLVETLNVKENIVLPLMFQHQSVDVMEERVTKLAEGLGISAILDKRVTEISGGQRQRVAIARAVIHQPALLLADEPTGNLDSKNSKEVMSVFKELNEQLNLSIFLVTHDAMTATYSDRIIFIKDGRLYNEIYRGDDELGYKQSIINVLEMMGE
ncbi:ABC transporter ATP-binding protein [Dolosigranulum pigrum]|uniref:ABC transporter ATP-binding protein n=1 Tax=Dolosigranulum pigrum TaxID=29394 RepID=UPI001AD8758F|nr:ABC transporter ATP-binding protein [Dolosigranulum pigrum]